MTVRTSRSERRSASAAGLLLAFTLGGCAAFGGSKPAPEPAATAAPAPDQLPAQTLLPGQCGVFLWTLAEPRRFVFFERAGDNAALFHVDGANVELGLTGVDGALMGAFAVKRSLRTPDGALSAQLDLTPGDALEGGQGISQARMTLTRPDGWRVVLPLAGVYACQPG